MKIVDFLQKDLVIGNLSAKTKLETLKEFSQCLEKAAGLKADKVLNVLLEREKLGSTGIGEGVAIPHGKLKEISKLICCFGKSEEGIDFDAIDGKPVHIIFLLLAPETSAGTHLKALARISKILKDLNFRQHLIKAKTVDDIYQIILEEDDKL